MDCAGSEAHASRTRFTPAVSTSPSEALENQPRSMTGESKTLGLEMETLPREKGVAMVALITPTELPFGQRNVPTMYWSSGQSAGNVERAF